MAAAVGQPKRQSGQRENVCVFVCVVVGGGGGVKIREEGVKGREKGPARGRESERVRE